VNNTLRGKRVVGALNSIGSNVFVNLGQYFTHSLRDGSKMELSEQSIWLGNTTWRLSRENVYIVGSADVREEIQMGIGQLCGMTFEGYSFLSKILEIEFRFSGGFKLTTFTDWKENNQWTVFFQDNPESNDPIPCFCVDFDDKCLSEIQDLDQKIKIDNAFHQIHEIRTEEKVSSIRGNSFHDIKIFFCPEEFLSLEACHFRLERDGNYLFGQLDFEDIDSMQSSLKVLIGNRLKTVEVNVDLDAKFTFENGYQLSVFTCKKAPIQWRFVKDGKELYIAKNSC